MVGAECGPALQEGMSSLARITGQEPTCWVSLQAGGYGKPAGRCRTMLVPSAHCVSHLYSIFPPKDVDKSKNDTNI